MKMKKNISLIIEIILFVILIVIASYGIIHYYKKSLHNYTQEIINYNEKNDIHYKVYLKENNYFEKDYLDEGKIYITSLIDYLDIDYKFLSNFDKKISGQYSYYFKAVVSANKQNSTSDKYLKKEYKLTDSKLVKYDNKNKIEIKDNVKVDYQKYNDLLLEFKKDYGISFDGSLEIVMVVENSVNSELVDHGYSKTSEMTVIVPLTKATIEVPIQVNDNSGKSSFISEPVYDAKAAYKVRKFVTAGWILLFGVESCLLIACLYKNRADKNTYEYKLKKIMKSYDDIIVSLDNQPKLNDFNVIVVKKFSELIDAYNEVRQPINYIENSKGSTFIMIKDKMAWKFDLEKE